MRENPHGWQPFCKAVSDHCICIASYPLKQPSFHCMQSKQLIRVARKAFLPYASDYRHRLHRTAQVRERDSAGLKPSPGERFAVCSPCKGIQVAGVALCSHSVTGNSTTIGHWSGLWYSASIQYERLLRRVRFGLGCKTCAGSFG